MVDLMKKVDVIMLKNKGLSNREVSRRTKLDRATVSKYWEEYKRKRHELMQEGADERQIQEAITSNPKYNANTRKKRKYTPEIEARLRELLAQEKQKDLALGAGHKQSMTNKQIFGIIQGEGYDVGYSAINNALAVLRRETRKNKFSSDSNTISAIE